MIGIRIAGAETSGEPVATAFGDSFTIGKHIKLTSAAGRNHGIDAEPLLDEGHETRDLGFVIPSSRARAYLDFHCGLLLKRTALIVTPGMRPSGISSEARRALFGNYVLPILEIPRYDAGMLVRARLRSNSLYPHLLQLAVPGYFDYVVGLAPTPFNMTKWKMFCGNLRRAIATSLP
jgi:hypothetical protein